MIWFRYAAGPGERDDDDDDDVGDANEGSGGRTAGICSWKSRDECSRVFCGTTLIQFNL